MQHCVTDEVQQRPQLGNLHAEKEHQDVQHYVSYDIQQHLQLGNLHAEKQHHSVQHYVATSSSIYNWDLQRRNIIMHSAVKRIMVLDAPTCVANHVVCMQAN